jgi:hypothetical protein
MWMLLQLVHVSINFSGCGLPNTTRGYLVKYQFIPKSSTYLVDDTVDHGCHSCIICHDDWPPFVVVNRVGLP